MLTRKHKDEEQRDTEIALHEIEDLQNGIKHFSQECEEAGGIPVNPELPEDFSRAEFVLGLNCAEDRIVNLDAYGKKIVVPQETGVFAVEFLEDFRHRCGLCLIIGQISSFVLC